MKQAKLTQKRVLVTGGAGFIGSNLAERLVEMGNRVTVVDNLITGKRSNLAGLEGHSDFRFVEGDVCDHDLCMELAADTDIVFHQAALGSVPRSIENPALSTSNNIVGTVNIFDAARRRGVRRVVYAASSSTYGDSKRLPKVEDEIGRPLSPYAITKYVSELYADNFARLYGIEMVGLRYFNVFGRRQDPQGAYAAVIPKFINLILDLKSPVINGDGSFSRDFTYIDNVVEANILAATTDNTEAVNTVYNIACGQRTTLNELFSLMRSELAKYKPECASVEAFYGPGRNGDIPHSLASIDRAKRLLGYQPAFDFGAGLAQTVRWFVENR